MLHRLFGRTHKDADRTPAPKRAKFRARLGLEPLEVRDNPSAFYVVPGAAGTTVGVSFNWLRRDAAAYSEIGVYTVDNASGSVNGIAPTAAGYTQAALASAVPIFQKGQIQGATAVQNFTAGTVLGFYITPSTTAASVRALNPGNAPPNAVSPYTNNAYFSFTGPDGFDHARASAVGTQLTVSFEDGFGGGDRDFNDAVIRVTPGNPNVAPGATGDSVAAAFRLNGKTSLGNGEVGVYTFDDVSGRVGGVLPGDPGYAAAVMRSATRHALFAPGAPQGALATVALPATGTFGFYFIPNGTAAQLLATNPTNQRTSAPVALFSVANANPDQFAHVRQNLNTVRFEASLDGGDQKYKDVVLSFVFAAPVRVAVPPALAPTISAVADQTINQNASTPALAFTVGSTRTAATNLAVTATSSNQTLVPDAQIVLAGTDANRTVTVTPVANLSGSATITLTVTDGTLTATQSFTVTVTPAGDPSFVASNPPAANFNAGAQTVPGFATFTPGANGGGTTAAYTVSGVSNPGLFSVQPAVAPDGTLTYTPVPGGFGSSTFAVSVSDGTNSSPAQTFTIAVSAVQGVAPTTIPGSSPPIDLSDPNWTVIPTLNSDGSTVADGTRVLDRTVGTGATVARGDLVTVAYRGYLLDGTVFDQNTSAQFRADITGTQSVIAGFAAGLVGMRVGGTRDIDISSYLAYGNNPPAGIPANARLVFEVTVNPPSFTASNPPTVGFNAGAQSVASFATYTPGGVNAGTTPAYTVSAVSNTGLFSVPPAVAPNGTLTYTPVTGGFGSSTFTVQASDGTNSTAPQTFTITVDPVQGVSPTTIPTTTIDLADPNWTTVSTPVAGGGTVANGTRILDTTVGSGAATVARGDLVTVTYTGYLLDGTVFDSNATGAQFRADITGTQSVIPGFAAGLVGLKVGGTRRIDIPSYLAYGPTPRGSIPANSRLVFEVTVVSIP